MLRKRLENGLDVIVQENNFSKMFALQCWINVGSLHEAPGEEGMSHCLEHMLFKGTRTYAVGELSRKVEFLGGDMNAYTSFEHTVYYLTLPASHAAEAVELLSEAILHSTFDPEELDREKEVILEEMKRNEDSPSHSLGRKIFEGIYSGTPAAQPIIGYESNIRGFTRQNVVDFHRKWYAPANMKIIGVGAINAEELFKDIAKHFGTDEARPISKPIAFKTSSPQNIPVHIITGDYDQPRVEIAFPGPGLLDEDLLPLDIAAFALGSGESSRLHRKVRDQTQLTSVVGCSLYAPQFGGVFEVSAMPHAETYLECVETLGKELANLRDREPVTKEELDRARANAKSDRVFSEETVSGLARALGNALHTPHELFYDYVVEAKTNRLTPFDIRKAVERWFQLDKAVIACVLPKGTAITADDVRAAFVKGTKKIAAPLQAPSRKADDNAVFHESLSPQISVIYRQQEHSDLMNAVILTSGGLRCETDNRAGQFHMFADLIGTATERTSYSEMLAQIEGQGAVLAGFSGRDSFGLKLQCLTEQAPKMFKLWTESLLEPAFLKEQLENSKLEIFDDIHMENDSPTSLAMRRFQQALYGHHPYRHPIWGTEDVVRGWTPQQLHKNFVDFRDQSHWIVSGVGRLPFEAFLEQIQPFADKLKAKIPRPTDLCQSLPHQHSDGHFMVKKDREQVHLVMGTLGVNWTDPDRHALDVLANVLGGSGGHFFIRLRDQQSLAYTVSPLHSSACHRGIFGAYMACSLHKLQEAEAGIKQVWEDVCNGGVTQADLDRSRNFLIGSHEGDMQRGDGQAMTMALMELYGLGYADFMRYANKLRDITLSDVDRVAKRLLLRQKHITVKVGPF